MSKIITLTGPEAATRWFDICEELDARLIALVFEMDLPHHQRCLRSLLNKIPIEILREVLREREQNGCTSEGQEPKFQK